MAAVPFGVYEIRHPVFGILYPIDVEPGAPALVGNQPLPGSNARTWQTIDANDDTLLIRTPYGMQPLYLAYPDDPQTGMRITVIEIPTPWTLRPAPVEGQWRITVPANRTPGGKEALALGFKREMPNGIYLAAIDAKDETQNWLFKSL